MGALRDTMLAIIAAIPGAIAGAIPGSTTEAKLLSLGKIAIGLLEKHCAEAPNFQALVLPHAPYNSESLLHWANSDEGSIVR